MAGGAKYWPSARSFTGRPVKLQTPQPTGSRKKTGMVRSVRAAYLA